MPVQYFSTPVRVRLQSICTPLKENEIYLRWCSTGGNWEGWLFGGESDLKTDLVAPTSYSPGAGRNSVALRRPGRDVLTVRAGDLSSAQHAAISTILDAPTVYRQFPSGALERVFVAENATAQRSTDEGKHVVAIDVELTRRNALTN